MNLTLDNRPILIQANSDFFLSVYASNLVKAAKNKGYGLPSNIQALDLFLRKIEPQIVKLDVLYLFVGDASVSFKLLNIVDPNKYEGEAFGGLVWQNLSGAMGNGLNAYINTKFNPSSAVDKKFALNSACYAAIVTNNTARGVVDGNSTIYGDRLTLDLNSRINSRTNGEFPVFKNTKGLKYFGRNSSATVISYDNEEIVNGNQVSLALLDDNKTLLRNYGGPGVQIYSSNHIGLYFLGSHLTFEEALNIKIEFDKYLAKI